MSSDDEWNRPGNSVAGLFNLQMRALNDSMSNMLNTCLYQIHQRLDEIQASQAPSRPGARRDRPRRNTRSTMKSERRMTKRTRPDQHTIQEEVLEPEIQVMSILLLEMNVLMIA